ncbi:MAG: iron-containing alcohol dehydrogenase [Lachnospiraceae bacterium]|nr:iron-containing alcohol dehydrogenase [Lachnospiraceae bacterium]
MSYFSLTPRVFIGKNAINEAMPSIEQLGTHAMIVTGPHVGKSPMVKNLCELLNASRIPHVVFDEITGEPTTDMIEKGAGIYRNNGCDFLIGIGGGSPLDSAKLIAIAAEGDRDFVSLQGKNIEGDIPPVAAIPTTAGTGSETTKFAVITDPDKNLKMLLRSEKIVPQIAVLDESDTQDMPKSVTASTGLDALTHAVEAYTSKKCYKPVDSIAVTATKRILKYLPKAYHDGYDTEARRQMMLAAFEAGICINNSSVTIVHGMSRPIGALFHVPHGLGNAMLITEALGFVADSAYSRFASLARETGTATEEMTDKEAAASLISAIDDMVRICKVPTLREYGIGEQEFMQAVPKMAADAIASGSPANSMREVSAEDCEKIYKSVYLESGADKTISCTA